MTSDLDIYRSANVLVERYGEEDVPVMAAMRADALLEQGHLDGYGVWIFWASLADASACI